MIGDSRQIPSLRVEIATASTTPRAAPSTVERPRSTRNSPSGEASDPSPSITNAARARASTAPVTSLSADSAMIVCATLGRIRMCSKSGMRIAGSVGARTAPMRRPDLEGHVEGERGDARR